MANVLITGVAGFIGSGIARAMVAQGASVRGIDNLSTGNHANLDDIRSCIEFRHDDILNAQAMNDACQDVDFVFHHAALSSVALSMQDPTGTHRVNVDGTLTVLEAARCAGVKRVVYASSSSVYGNSPALPKRESMTPEPISPYAAQKLASEQHLAEYSRNFGLETVALRYFNVFGPRQNPSSPYSGVLARFISQTIAGNPCTIFGDGTQSRDFVFIDDVVSANLLAAKSSADVSGRAFNIASGTRRSLHSVFADIKHIVGYTDSATFAEQRAGDIKHSLADISLAREVLGYEAATDFRTGLEKTIAWYRSA